MRIYFKNNHAKFHPDLISNNWALSFLKRSLPQEENKMSSDMGSVPGPRKKNKIMLSITDNVLVIIYKHV